MLAVSNLHQRSHRSRALAGLLELLLGSNVCILWPRLPYGHFSLLHVQVGDIHALVQRLSSASTPLPA